MSDQRRFKWKSGRLTAAPIQEGWAIDLFSRDPFIPNLPLEPYPPATAGYFSLLARWVSGAGVPSAGGSSDRVPISIAALQAAQRASVH